MTVLLLWVVAPYLLTRMPELEAYPVGKMDASRAALIEGF